MKLVYARINKYCYGIYLLHDDGLIQFKTGGKHGEGAEPSWLHKTNSLKTAETWLNNRFEATGYRPMPKCAWKRAAKADEYPLASEFN